MNPEIESNKGALIPIKKSKKRKVCFLGAPGVGKSAVIIRFRDDIFVDFYNPTIETVHKKSFTFLNENIELDIMDNDGETEYTIMNLNKFSHGIHGYALCYSVENLQSFKLIPILFSKIISFSPDIPKVIVANKSDLINRR
jgi:GTPase SAR1 family protein